MAWEGTPKIFRSSRSYLDSGYHQLEDGWTRLFAFVLVGVRDDDRTASWYFHTPNR